MKSNNRRRLAGLLLVFCVCLLCTTAPFQQFASFPHELRLFDGQSKQLHLSMPVSADVSVDNPDLLRVNGHIQHSFKVNLNEPISLDSRHSGQAQMKLKLFGKIPLKTLTVNIVPDLKVIPGGQTIGVKLKSAGVLVVGHHLIPGKDGQKVSPGEKAKLQLGDLITEMNGVKIVDVTKVSPLVEEAGKSGKPIKLKVQRNGKTFDTEITPEYDENEKTYRLGLYIRDSAAGVGTLTFYAPDHGVYGALGHVITDMDTQTPIVVGGGEIVPSNVTSISKSQNGEPGEKRAHLIREDQVMGNIERNTDFGIFGRMYKAPEKNEFNEPVPVAFAEEITEGPAHIYTVVEGQKVEKFDIEVVHVAKQDAPATKGMVIKITDPKLLSKTGGIVQGMSGSPIIQNGKLIGAVTHVFVNDPSSGYGCFVEWMLRDAGIMIGPSAQNPKAS
ncbi:SpoIVB peptidase [Paenibacillus turpanensis]|uniref:SpoIVB peptidase n=1 Tax=Paenibacillus turpanensis TaxID=2689078 RepID=UPI00140E0632|nr:SpoIVB peptidase [Paenibacillus turpanensis]